MGGPGRRDGWRRASTGPRCVSARQASPGRPWSGGGVARREGRPSPRHRRLARVHRAGASGAASRGLCLWRPPRHPRPAPGRGGLRCRERLSPPRPRHRCRSMPRGCPVRARRASRPRPARRRRRGWRPDRMLPWRGSQALRNPLPGAAWAPGMRRPPGPRRGMCRSRRRHGPLSVGRQWRRLPHRARWCPPGTPCRWPHRPGRRPSFLRGRRRLPRQPRRRGWLEPGFGGWPCTSGRP